MIEPAYSQRSDLSKFKPWLRPEENGALIPNTRHACIVCGDRPVHLRNGSEWICERCYNAATRESGNGPAPAPTPAGDRWSYFPPHRVLAADIDQLYAMHFDLVETFKIKPLHTAVVGMATPEDLTEWILKVAQSEEVETKWREAREREEEERERILPVITWQGEERLRDVTEDAISALLQKNNPPYIFVRSGKLVRIRTDGETGQPIIEEMSESVLKHRLERCANFIKYVPKKRVKGEAVQFEEKPIVPPKDVILDIMAADCLPFPPLQGVITTPIIRLDNKLIASPGYDDENLTYYHPLPGFTMPGIPDEPTVLDNRRAVELLEEIIIDFPFVEDGGSRTNAIAAMFTAVLRPMINGPVPFALFDKPQRGTGASLLAECINIIATGREAAMFTAPVKDEEWKKNITSQVRSGKLIVTVDNIEGKLYAPSLASVLTSTIWQDRLLGQNEIVTLPHRIFWIGTGNNIQLGGDLPRRCFWIRMDANEAQPWKRSGFKHPNIKEWVMEKRGDIVAAILTLARSWILAGRPAPDDLPKLGGFEAWVEVIGGILSYHKIAGFLGNQEALYDEADADGKQWEIFIQALYENWPAVGFTAQDIKTRLAYDTPNHPEEGDAPGPLLSVLPDRLADAWEGKNKGSFQRKLGNALSKKIDVKFSNGLKIIKDGDVRRAIRYKVVKS